MRLEEFYKIKINFIMKLSKLQITNTEDKSWLKKSAENSKNEILKNLGLSRPEWLVFQIKKYLINFLKHK